MLTLTLGDINDESFNKVLNKLAVSDALDVKTSYNVGRLLKEVDRETRDARINYMEVIKKYAILDEKGELVPQKRNQEVDGEVKEVPVPGTWTFKEPEDATEKEAVMKKWKQENEEFMKIEVEFPKVWKLTLDQLKDVKLSPVEINDLEPLLDVAPDLRLVD